MQYLAEWERSVADRDGFSRAQKAMMTLSRETIEGLRITGRYLNVSYGLCCSIIIVSFPMCSEIFCGANTLSAVSSPAYSWPVSP